MNILCITTLKLINLQKKSEKIDTFSLNDFFVEIYFNDKNRLTTTNGIRLILNGMKHLFFLKEQKKLESSLWKIIDGLIVK